VCLVSKGCLRKPALQRSHISLMRECGNISCVWDKVPLLSGIAESQPTQRENSIHRQKGWNARNKNVVICRWFCIENLRKSITYYVGLDSSGSVCQNLKLKRHERKSSMLMHVVTPALCWLTQEGPVFETSLGYIARPNHRRLPTPKKDRHERRSKLNGKCFY
jgi:hypothetical protein